MDCRLRVPGLDIARLAALDRGDERSALRRAVSLSRSAVSGLSVTIDASRPSARRPAAPSSTPSRWRVRLARTGEVDVGWSSRQDVAHLRPAPGWRMPARSGLDPTYEEAVAGVELTDIVHPSQQQVFSVR